ncbi:MAG: hypothetical protein MJ189_03625 [Coriobacteriales bacterium]|nr:hypothetical protein [Coriobacteriales bacterium]
MKRLISLTMVLALICGCCLFCAGCGVDPHAKDREDIKVLGQTYCDAMTSGDYDKLMNCMDSTTSSVTTGTADLAEGIWGLLGVDLDLKGLMSKLQSYLKKSGINISYELKDAKAEFENDWKAQAHFDILVKTDYNGEKKEQTISQNFNLTKEGDSWKIDNSEQTMQQLQDGLGSIGDMAGSMFGGFGDMLGSLF